MSPAGLFNHTATVQQLTTAPDALKGVVTNYANLYADVPGRFQDLSDRQQAALLLQHQIVAQSVFFCQLPGPVPENRAGLVFDGGFYRVTGVHPRRAIRGLETFHVVYLTSVTP